MSNMSITIRNQINAGSGKRAHPEHLKALAATKKEGQGRVRVEPTNEALRHVLRHPNGMAFRAQGTVEWPWDRFTQRRLRDGSIRVVEQADARKAAAPAEKPKEDKKEKRKRTRKQARGSSGARAVCTSVINAVASASPRHLRLVPRAPARTAAI